MASAKDAAGFASPRTPFLLLPLLLLLVAPAAVSAANYCGSDWADASSCSHSSCPRGIDADCPMGMRCYAGTRCGVGGVMGDNGGRVVGGGGGNGETSESFAVSHSSETFARDCIGREDERLLALTFDDGPWSYTPGILDILEKKGARATFFVISSILDQFPRDRYEAIVRRIVRDGHTVANHGIDNEEFTIEDVEECHQEISRITKGYGSEGYEMRLFRPARGAYTKANHQRLVDMGYRMVMWNLDTTDWKQERSASDILSFVRSSVLEPMEPPPMFDQANYDVPRRGSFIMLAHDNNAKWTSMVDNRRTLLEAVIDEARGAGYKIVTLDECLGLEPHKYDPSLLDAYNDVPAHTGRFCGRTYADAATCGNGKCPSGMSGECPNGMKCFSGMTACPDFAGGEDGLLGTYGGFDIQNGGVGGGLGKNLNFTYEDVVDYGKGYGKGYGTGYWKEELSSSQCSRRAKWTGFAMTILVALGTCLAHMC